MKIPVEALSPEEALRRCARGERPFLLDGAGDGDGLGRYSFAGCDPDDGIVWRVGDAGDPFSLLEEAQKRWTVGPVDDAWPVAVGFVSYDAAVNVLARAHGRSIDVVDDLGVPGVDFARYPAIWRFDRQTGEAVVIGHDAAAAERLIGRLGRTPVPLHPTNAGALQAVWSKEQYERKVERILEHLRAGDCYQVNLAQRFVGKITDAGALSLYLALRSVAPAPLGAYLATDRGTILSNSPELLLAVRTEKIDGRYGVVAETRPIKGTRPRGTDEASDAREQDALVRSEKDAAEHLMIVDLLRNDLGRCATIGSVKVDGPRVLTLPTVHHLVSTVTARVDSTSRSRASTRALLASMLPGGSVTGAPKLRACEIIASLEERARGVYCGALGWIGAGRALTLALPIRTGLVRDGELVVPVGGGVVIDSTPASEWEETRIKVRAFERAIAS